MHVVKEVLGGDCRMQYAGLVLSLYVLSLNVDTKGGVDIAYPNNQE